MESDQQQLRNLRDFLLVYNRMTEICFQRCSSNFNYRSLTMDEERCADSCAGKLIRSNHRLMGTYVQLMPKMVQRRMEEMESKAAEATKAAEGAGAEAGALEGAGAGAGALEGAGAVALPGGSALVEPPLHSDAPEMIPSALSGTTDFAAFQTSTSGLSADVPVMPSPGPVLGDTMASAEVPATSTSVFNRVESEVLFDHVPAASLPIATPPMEEVKMAAATPVTPTAMPLSSLSKAVSGAALSAVPPLESPLILRESTTANARALPISAPIVPENPALVTSVPPSFTPATPVMPVEVTPLSSPVLSTVPQAAATPVVTPSLGQPEGAKPMSAPVLALPVAPPQTVSIPVPSSSDVSLSPSIAPSTVTKQDSQPPS